MYTFEFRRSPADEYQQAGLFDYVEQAQEAREAMQASHWSIDVSCVYAVEA
jgi:hypothetical protein